MNRLRRICEEETDLTGADIARLEALCEQLPLIAELNGTDVFIDCMTRTGQMVVAAQARPAQTGSLYGGSVTGAPVTEEREPAVYQALRLGTPVRDLKAVTQEGRAVRQDAAPVRGGGGACIAVLIQERDISDDLRRERKFEALARRYEQEALSLRADGGESCGSLVLREIHHRVKNNLQLIASILSLQARRCADGEAGALLRENVERVLSIAAIYDILTKKQDGDGSIDSLQLLETLQHNLRSLVPGGRNVAIEVRGDHAPLDADTATAAALVVNELVTNALKHAFRDREGGMVAVTFQAGRLCHTLTVEDDGAGFAPDAPAGLGLRMVRATAREKLGGGLTVHSGASGSRFVVEIKRE